MKRITLFILFAVCSMSVGYAQKFAYVNTETILSKMPDYTAAQNTINKLREQYQAQVESEMQKVDQLFRSYQTDKGRLTEAQRQQREQNIIAKEQEAKELQRSYFGQEGTLAAKSEALLKPIRGRVQQAIDDFAKQGGYAVIFDIAASQGFIYTNPAFDMSGRILEKLGYKN